MTGDQFEKQVSKVLEVKTSKKGHYHKNNALRLHSGEYIQGEPFDFEVFLPNYLAVFDCKSLNSDNWQIREKDIKQAYNLLRCKQVGLKAYFLINFNGIVKEIDIDFVIDKLEKNIKHIKKEEILGEWSLLNLTF